MFPLIDIFLYGVTHRLFMFPLPPNTDQFIWLLLALVTNPIIYK